MISGRVQGVFFRQGATRVAQAADCSGWVRNLPDGRVEVVIEGSAEAVERVLTWCREGPERAVVEQVEVAEEEPEGLVGFEVRH